MSRVRVPKETIATRKVHLDAPAQAQLSEDEIQRVARLFVLLATVKLPESSKACGDEELPETE